MFFWGTRQVTKYGSLSQMAGKTHRTPHKRRNTAHASHFDWLESPEGTPCLTASPYQPVAGAVDPGSAQLADRVFCGASE